MRKVRVWTVLAVVLALLLSTACAAVQPAAPAADQPAAPAGGEAAADNLLTQIQAKGKLVVGTSADYPPYESIDAEGKFVGFDMDLIRAVGEKLGVEVEIQDLPFDTLIAGVQEGKIDAIIAAMQATPEREEMVDFSIPYRPTKDAFLGKGDTAIVIAKAEDAAGYTIGAQTGTVQEKWIQDNLVDKGLTPADKVFSYERADQAALDLGNGRLELLLMDAEPAMSLADQSGLKLLLVTSDTTTGGKSIAIPDGSAELKAELDKIIQGLIDDGTVQKIQEANGLP